MLTVLMEAGDDAEALARTLASLVGGAVEGVVREVMVFTREASADALRVADHAGCVILEGELDPGLRRAKGDWLLLLEPGARMAEGWTDAVRAHVETSSDPARFSEPRTGHASFFVRLVRKRRPVELGLLMTKDQALARGVGSHTVAALARGLRMTRLAANITPARRE